jgi:predicted DNA binding CopG/RHH family protein
MTASHHLDPEEQQLLDDDETGSMRSVASPELLDGLRAAARATGLKDQHINIRLSSVDLQALRTRALQEGMPYQTLISSVLHKDLSGALRESPRPGHSLQSMPVIDQQPQQK